MLMNLEEFRRWPRKKITLMGMSGVGKTHLSCLLRDHDWFHYSGDYRIGTRYLDEAILDMIKHQAMAVPFLRDLLRKDWIYIRNNIKVDDLGPVLSFVGKPGDPQHGGVPLPEFIRRQAAYREAEVQAMQDLPDFISKAEKIYGYQHFVNDVGGSLCELESPEVLDTIIKHTIILYIEVTTSQEEQQLIDRAQSAPKPLYYRPEFLQQHLHQYVREKGLNGPEQMDPDEFTRWVFPYLFRSRLPRYDAIAEPHGYRVTSDDVAKVRDEKDFLELMEKAISARHGS